MKLLLSNARTRWFILAAMWATLIVLGVGGFRQQASDSGVDQTFLDTLYLTLQLATLNFDASTDYLNWRLQIARFVAPLMAAGTVLQAASLVFADQFHRFRLRWAKNHTVVCGLGDVGTRLALAYAGRGDTVVAIEPDGSVTGVESAKDAGVTVLIGDASDRALLTTARIDRAARVVAVCGDDATNVQIALSAAAVVGNRPGKALRCAVHLTDAELTNLLRVADLDGRGAVRMSFFNTHERAARALLAEHSPFVVDPATGVYADAHLVLFGLGQLGRSVVVAAAQQWASSRPDVALPITLIDPTASGRWQALRMQHPALETVCNAITLDLDLEAPSPENVVAITQIFSEQRPTWVGVLVADESLALSTAFFIHQNLGVRGIPLVVRTRTDSGLGALLIPSGTGSDSFPQVHAFPFLDRTCTTESVEGGLREQLAEAVHEDYVNQLANQTSGDPTLLRPWDELDDDQRDLSRRRVDGIIADLASIGYELAPLRRWGVVSTTFTREEIDQLAAREHKRWYDDRLSSGWTHGPTRDNTLKKNPLLVEWTKLGDGARASNLEAADHLAAMLASAGFEPVRR